MSLSKWDFLDPSRFLSRLSSAISGSTDQSDITAATAGTKEGATALGYGINLVTTSTKNSNDSVKAPPAVKDARFTVINTAVNDCKLFSDGDDQVNEGDSSISLNSGYTYEFVCPVDGQWYQSSSKEWAD